jgi:hypothetical protein
MVGLNDGYADEVQQEEMLTIIELGMDSRFRGNDDGVAQK